MNKVEKLFKLSWKRLVLIIIAWIVAVVLHNLLSAAIGTEEAFFFIIAIFVLPIYLIIAAVYSLVAFIKK
ncbi:MAG: hypothetical protein ACKKL6_00080 [Candidatus Komeilibacteria bacterium]